MRDMLTYCRLIIRDALRHGGQGWQEYNRKFRSQVTIEWPLWWNSLLPDLQASTTLGQHTTGGVHCSFCRGVDHVTTQCVLGFMQQLLTSQPSAGVTSSTMSGGSRIDLGNPAAGLSATRGIQAGASIWAPAHFGTFVPPATSTTRQGTVNRPHQTPLTGMGLVDHPCQNLLLRAANHLHRTND